MSSASRGARLLDLAHSPVARYLCGRAFVRDLLLILLTLSAMGGALGNGFVNLDDSLYAGENVNVMSGLSPETVAWAFETFHASNWHPLTWVSLQLDAELWGPSPATFHRTNLVLHIANVLLVAEVLRRMTGRFWPSAAAAALFGVHPLHVESVAWVSERKDVLSTFFGLLALAAYVRYARRPGPARMLPVCLAHAASLLAKPMLVTLPVLLLVLDYWPLRRWMVDGGWWMAKTTGEDPSSPPTIHHPPSTIHHPPSTMWRLVLEKAPLFLLAAASGVMTVLSQSQSGALKSLARYPAGLRVANALNSVVCYLGQTFWPFNLTVFYPYPQEGFPWPLLLGEAVLLIVMSGACLYLARRQPYWLAGWLWYLIALAPVIGLVQVGRQAHADRYTYVPLIGIFVALAWGLDDLAGPWRRFLGRAALAALLAGCVVASRAQVRYWADSCALWGHALAVTDHNAFAMMGYGKAFFADGRPDEAIAWYRQAVDVDPTLDRAWWLLGQAYESRQRWQDALACYDRADGVDPTNPIYRAAADRLRASVARDRER